MKSVLLLESYHFHITNSIALDIYAHASILSLHLEQYLFPFPPGYPFLLWVFSGFRNHIWSFLLIGNILMPLAVTGFVWILYRYLRDEIRADFLHLSPQRRNLLLVLLALSFFWIYPVYMFSGTWYIGRVSPIPWHSPTYLLMLPFALVTFINTPGFLQDPSRNYWKVLVPAVLSLLFKPSFLFAWLPGVFVYAVLMNRRPFSFYVKVFIPLFVPGVIILLQYYMVYVRGNLDALVYEDAAAGSVQIGFMEVWREFLSYGGITLWQSLLASFLFPGLFFLLYGRSGKISQLTQLSLFVLFFGLAFSVFFYESGARMYHGNFLWNAFAANMMVFVATTVNSCRYSRSACLKNVKAGWLS